MNTHWYRGWTPGLGAVQSIVATAGVISTAIGQGDSLVVSLPTGATWGAVPTAPGAAVDGGTIGTSTPATFSGLRASTIAALSWTDQMGLARASLLNITVSAVPSPPAPGPPVPTPPAPPGPIVPPGPPAPAAASTGMSTGTVVAIGVGVVALAGLIYVATRPKVVASSTPRRRSRYA